MQEPSFSLRSIVKCLQGKERDRVSRTESAVKRRLIQHVNEVICALERFEV